jgi:hypothetical protein
LKGKHALTAKAAVLFLTHTCLPGLETTANSSFLFFYRGGKMNKILIKRVSAIILIAASFAALTYAFSRTKTIDNTGNVLNGGVEVYWDLAFTQPVSLIDWGNVTPNTHTVKSFYLYNPGSASVYVTWITQNWNPTQAPTYILVTLPTNGTLAGNQTQTVQIDLFVDPAVNGTTITNFSFNIVVTGS